jgi:predicted nucleic acid-binding protein
VKALLIDDSAIATWWGTAIECVSAMERLGRDGLLALESMHDALERLRAAASSWTEVPATPSVREQAIRLLRVHRLRAGDAVQLAAAIVASDFEMGTLDFVTLDANQADAARREGFRVLS